MRTFLLTLVVVTAVLFTAAPALAQANMSVTGTPYYQSNYRVGLTCSWSAVSGAAEYLVKHERADACGSATHFQTVTGTASSSGAHPNCDEFSCYAKTCTVYALSSSGVVLAHGTASICQTGCASGSCPDCDEDGTCEPGETRASCGLDCSFCEWNNPCYDNNQCGRFGVCTNGACVCAD